MRLSQAWIIAAKDFQTFGKKKNIIYTTFVVPLLVSVGLPLVVRAVERRLASGALTAELTTLLPTFAWVFLVLAGITPTTIASYTIVGEKIERSLEALLATPTTDSEILVGKGLAAFLPALGAILGGGIIFMALMDAVTRGALGYDFFPNGSAALVLFVLVPLAALMSIEWNVIISARVNDVRAAQQIGMLLMLPFAALYVAGELRLIGLGVTRNLLIIAGILLAVDVVFLYLSRATFRRDEILTKWK
ncbi:MAG TPA: ABC transporter permease subunit [Chloroflexota bacterium]|nr:ABC transporter permease subunit [Chloroflexota bacterium]